MCLCVWLDLRRKIIHTTRFISVAKLSYVDVRPPRHPQSILPTHLNILTPPTPNQPTARIPEQFSAVTFDRMFVLFHYQCAIDCEVKFTVLRGAGRSAAGAASDTTTVRDDDDDNSSGTTAALHCSGTDDFAVQQFRPARKFPARVTYQSSGDQHSNSSGW